MQLNSQRPGSATVVPLDVTWSPDRLRQTAVLAQQVYPKGIDYFVYATGWRTALHITTLLSPAELCADEAVRHKGNGTAAYNLVSCVFSAMPTSSLSFRTLS